MSKKCVHKGCGKTYEDDNEDCVYHPGPPVSFFFVFLDRATETPPRNFMRDRKVKIPTCPFFHPRLTADSLPLILALDQAGNAASPAF